MQTHSIIMHTNDHHNINIPTTTKENNKNFTTAPQPRSHSSTAQACAACKYRRRKCTSDCILSPYFPHDRQPQFSNAHRLFGVSNIIKIIQHLTQPERELSMKTIIFESDARAADPVGGCYRIIRELELRISLAKAELEVVLHHLAICRAAAASQRQVVVVPPPDDGDYFDERCLVLEDEIAIIGNVDSWGCTNGNFHEHAESPSSSLSHHGRMLSPDESTNDHMIKPILDHLACDDFR